MHQEQNTGMHQIQILNNYPITLLCEILKIYSSILYRLIWAISLLILDRFRRSVRFCYLEIDMEDIYDG